MPPPPPSPPSVEVGEDICVVPPLEPKAPPEPPPPDEPEDVADDVDDADDADEEDEAVELAVGAGSVLVVAARMSFATAPKSDDDTDLEDCSWMATRRSTRLSKDTSLGVLNGCFSEI